MIDRSEGITSYGKLQLKHVKIPLAFRQWLWKEVFLKHARWIAGCDFFCPQSSSEPLAWFYREVQNPFRYCVFEMNETSENPTCVVFYSTSIVLNDFQMVCSFSINRFVGGVLSFGVDFWMERYLYVWPAPLPLTSS